MKKIETVVKIENPGKNVYRFTFPEYPDCPEYADANLSNALDVVPVFLAVYCILNKDGELSPHKRPLLDFYEYSGNVFSCIFNCDIKSTEEFLKDSSVSPDAFFNWAQEETDSVVNKQIGSKKSEPAKKSEPEEKKPEPEKETRQGINIMETVKEQKRRSNDVTADLSDFVDDDVADDILANKSRGQKPTPKKKKFDSKKK